MIDREVVAMAVERMTPEAKQAARQQAQQRGMTLCDAVLEECLTDLQGQLYALRHRKPTLEVLEGGRV
ncbi:hypothetical protein RAN53_09440 [Halomonas sp. SSL-5]|uniref:hypothetical protein n=1 Tax=Halomonas sp. SSL-5 TaxID=3065855 RepID=UPI0027397923|nr:hypothetical protein [Halomonas sp. SSL-5]MDY7116573.1 hypothetical protein [Halomonas sp. SSL-5]